VVAACPFPLQRGTPARILRMSETLAGRGHEIHVVTYHLGQGDLDGSLHIHRTPRVRSYRKLSPGPSYRKLLLLDPLLAMKLSGLLREGEIDLIHAHHFEGALAAWPARKWFGKPLVFDVHTLLESELPFYGMGMPQRIKRRAGGWLDRIVPRMADHVIAVSEEIKQRLVRNRGLSADRISVVPSGVETAMFNTPRDTEPGVEAGKRGETLVFSGNLAAYQRIDLLLRAVAPVLRRRPAAELLIVTDGGLGDHEAMAADLGIRDRIRVISADLAELPGILARADVALNPRTECDGLPQKVLNYMAAEMPIVSFAGSARHLEHEVSGLIVPDGDVEAFAGAILRLLSDPDLAARLGADAREIVRTELSWTRNAERTESVYERVLGRA
jgi:glycosyltransferase involved in cell wall biosynthesis